MAAHIGNKHILSYLILIIKKRDLYVKLMKEQGKQLKTKYLSFKEILEFKTYDGFTPFLFACRDNNLPIFRLLFEEDCEIYL